MTKYTLKASYHLTQLALVCGTLLYCATSNAAKISMPVTGVKNVVFINNMVIPSKLTSSATPDASMLDVSEFDHFLLSMRPHASHYPPRFENRTHRYNSTQKIREWSAWIEPYASAPDASFDVLLRAAKINVMARNLDQGEAYAGAAGRYITRANTLKPDDAETQFIFGAMLAEGGAFREGLKYLEKAAANNYTRAHQSIAQAYLLTERRAEALEKLQYFKLLEPSDTRVDAQIQAVERGEFYIWKYLPN